MFPQYKRHRKIYGNLLDADFNIRMMCIDCHISQKNLPTWNERQFREAAELMGFELPAGSKSLKEAI
jgi:hypothetical protein